MRIATLTMQNWMPYAGLQTLHLEGKAYSVVARLAGDDDRSNWGGKTALLQAPYFALYGEHPARTEDGWITEGAKEGSVSLLLTDGHDHINVDRARKRGKSTQLVVKHAKDARVGAVVEMKGDEAQEFLNQRLGLTSQDFTATCYFAQRQMARMVLAKPQDRMDIVGAWLRLEPLIKAEEHVRKELADLSVEMDVIRQNLNTAQRMLDVELGNHDDSTGVVPVSTTPEALLAALTVKEVQLGELEKQKDQVGQRVQEARRLAVARSRVAEYERIVEAGTKVKAELEGTDLKALVAAEEEARQLEQDMAVLVGQYERDLQQKRKVALGQFDGVCPVAGIDCPATDTINKKTKGSRDAFAIAETTLKNGRSEYNILTDQHQEARRERTAAEALKIRLGALRDQVRALKDDYELAKSNTAIHDSEALETEYTQVCNRVPRRRAARWRGRR
jgi:DNA repair exonuclease SbcCD ATPase subunit